MLPTGFRAVLQESYLRRRGRNPQYSLRAFARDLALSPSRLCEIMKGRESLSRTTAEQVGERLGLTGDERTLFCDMVEAESARSLAVRSAAKRRVETQLVASAPKRLAADEYAFIADWYHLAILEALSLPDVDPTPAAIAKTLGITTPEAAGALRRLESLGLVRIRGGVVEKLADDVTTTSDVPSAAIRAHHEQMLEKAGTALHFEPMARRTFESLIVKFRSERAAEAFACLRAFVGKFNAAYGHDADSDAVYALTMQFFPLSKDQGHDAS